jgi:hypothetical protein
MHIHHPALSAFPYFLCISHTTTIIVAREKKVENSTAADENQHHEACPHTNAVGMHGSVGKCVHFNIMSEC